MPDILHGYTYSQSASRFRDTSTGKFVARARITQLVEAQVNRAEERLGNIVQSLFAKEIAPGVAQDLMRDELRRLSLQNIALGKGGMDKLTFRDYGRAGNQLRDTYQRMTTLTQEVNAGTITLPQAMQRVKGYVGAARKDFYTTQKETMAASGRTFEQRRRLNPAEHCNPCIRYASMGWRPLGELPAPGDGSTPCGVWCRCTMETREVTPEMLAERNRERVAA